MINTSRTFSSYAVKDLKVAEQYYTEVLGLEVTENNMGILELNLDKKGQVIIYPKPDHRAASFTVLNFMVEYIDDTVDLLINKGVKFEQYTGEIDTNEKGISKNPHGPAIAWFKDPDGNILSVIEERKE